MRVITALCLLFVSYSSKNFSLGRIQTPNSPKQKTAFKTRNLSKPIKQLIDFFRRKGVALAIFSGRRFSTLQGASLFPLRLARESLSGIINDSHLLRTASLDPLLIMGSANVSKAQFI